VTTIQPKGFSAFFKEIRNNHLLVFVCLTFIKIYIDIAWFLIVYNIQGSQSGDTSVFFNGMLLGCVSMSAVSSSGLIMKYFNPYNL
jgi:hypothetical protein